MKKLFLSLMTLALVGCSNFGSSSYVKIKEVKREINLNEKEYKELKEEVYKLRYELPNIKNFDPINDKIRLTTRELARDLKVEGLNYKQKFIDKGKELPTNVELPFVLDGKTYAYENSWGVLSVSSELKTITGNDNGINILKVYNYDEKTKEKLELKDLFKDSSYKSYMIAKIRKEIRKDL